MIPERKKEINGYVVEEFYWSGEYPVYVNNCLVNISFGRAYELAEKNEIFNRELKGE